jgi:hypothetical protein
MAENPRESNGYVAKVYEGERIIPARELTPDNGYTVGVDVAKPGSDRTAITLRLDVDVSDALTGLKALRREADAAVRALKKLDEHRDALAELQAIPGCLSVYTTEELVDELLRREGVRGFTLSERYGFSVDDGKNRGDFIGPARIVVIQE